MNEDEYYKNFPPKENPSKLPTPPFDVQPHWSIAFWIIGFLLVVAVGWGAFILMILI